MFLLALILSLSVGPVLVTAAVCEWGFVSQTERNPKCPNEQVDCA